MIHLFSNNSLHTALPNDQLSLNLPNNDNPSDTIILKKGTKHHFLQSLKSGEIIDATCRLSEKISETNLPPLENKEQLKLIHDLLKSEVTFCIPGYPITLECQFKLSELLLELYAPYANQIEKIEIVGSFIQRILSQSPEYLCHLLENLGIQNPEVRVNAWIEEVKNRPLMDVDIRFRLKKSGNITPENLSNKILTFLINKLGVDNDWFRSNVKLSKFCKTKGDGIHYTIASFGSFELSSLSCKNIKLECIFAKEMPRECLFEHQDFRIDILPCLLAPQNKTSLALTCENPKPVQNIISLLGRVVQINHPETVNEDGFLNAISHLSRGYLFTDIAPLEILRSTFLKTTDPEKRLKKIDKCLENHHTNDRPSSAVFLFNTHVIHKMTKKEMHQILTRRGAVSENSLTSLFTESLGDERLQAILTLGCFGQTNMLLVEINQKHYLLPKLSSAIDSTLYIPFEPLEAIESMKSIEDNVHALETLYQNFVHIPLEGDPIQKVLSQRKIDSLINEGEKLLHHQHPLLKSIGYRILLQLCQNKRHIQLLLKHFPIELFNKHSQKNRESLLQGLMRAANPSPYRESLQKLHDLQEQFIQSSDQKEFLKTWILFLAETQEPDLCCIASRFWSFYSKKYTQEERQEFEATFTSALLPAGLTEAQTLFRNLSHVSQIQTLGPLIAHSLSATARQGGKINLQPMISCLRDFFEKCEKVEKRPVSEDKNLEKQVVKFFETLHKEHLISEAKEFIELIFKHGYLRKTGDLMALHLKMNKFKNAELTLTQNESVALLSNKQWFDCANATLKKNPTLESLLSHGVDKLAGDNTTFCHHLVVFMEKNPPSLELKEGIKKNIKPIIQNLERDGIIRLLTSLSKHKISVTFDQDTSKQCLSAFEEITDLSQEEAFIFLENHGSCETAEFLFGIREFALISLKKKEIKKALLWMQRLILENTSNQYTSEAATHCRELFAHLKKTKNQEILKCGWEFFKAIKEKEGLFDQHQEELDEIIEILVAYLLKTRNLENFIHAISLTQKSSKPAPMIEKIVKHWSSNPSSDEADSKLHLYFIEFLNNKDNEEVSIEAAIILYLNHLIKQNKQEQRVLEILNHKAIETFLSKKQLSAIWTKYLLKKSQEICPHNDPSEHLLAADFLLNQYEKVKNSPDSVTIWGENILKHLSPLTNYSVYPVEVKSGQSLQTHDVGFHLFNGRTCHLFKLLFKDIVPRKVNIPITTTSFYYFVFPYQENGNKEQFFRLMTSLLHCLNKENKRDLFNYSQQNGFIFANLKLLIKQFPEHQQELIDLILEFSYWNVPYETAMLQELHLNYVQALLEEGIEVKIFDGFPRKLIELIMFLQGKTKEIPEVPLEKQGPILKTLVKNLVETDNPSNAVRAINNVKRLQQHLFKKPSPSLKSCYEMLIELVAKHPNVEFQNKLLFHHVDEVIFGLDKFLLLDGTKKGNEDLNQLCTKLFQTVYDTYKNGEFEESWKLIICYWLSKFLANSIFRGIFKGTQSKSRYFLLVEKVYPLTINLIEQSSEEAHPPLIDITYNAIEGMEDSVHYQITSLKVLTNHSLPRQISEKRSHILTDWLQQLGKCCNGLHRNKAKELFNVAQGKKLIVSKKDLNQLRNFFK